MSDDYINWNNNLKKEEQVETKGKPFLIKRYPVSHNRLRYPFALIKRINFFLCKHFNKIYLLLSPILDYLFLKNQGPWCPKLWKYLQENENKYSLLVVKSYLYSPNYYSLEKTSINIKKLFIVTGHEEPEFKLNFVNKSINNSSILGFVSIAEKNLCNKIWSNSKQKISLLLPPGIDMNETIDSEVRTEIAEISKKKFFIYLGRIDKHKNVDFIFNQAPDNCFIVFAGDLKCDIPQDPRFCYVGKISEAEKKLLLQNALALLIASRLEAYSIVTAESIYNNCLVLALKGCDPVDELIQNYGGLSCSESDFKRLMTEIWENKLKKSQIKIESEKIKNEKSWENNADIILELIQQQQ